MTLKPKLMWYFILAFVVLLGAGFWGIREFIRIKSMERWFNDQELMRIRNDEAAKRELHLNDVANDSSNQQAFGVSAGESLDPLKKTFLGKIWFTDFNKFFIEKSMKWDWKDWDFREDFILADVVDTIPAERKMALSVLLPSDKIFSEKILGDSVLVNVTCNSGNSVLLGNDLKLKVGVDDVFNLTKTGKYRIYTKCLDEGCKDIGYGCIFVEM